MTAAIINWRGWLKHRFFYLALFVAMLLLLRLGWGWYVHRQLERLFADIKSRGEFVAASDVTYVPVPDSDNVWKLQFRAASALAPGVDSPLESNLEYPNYLPFPAAWRQLSDASEKANSLP